jgi:hypothetical protein
MKRLIFTILLLAAFTKINAQVDVNLSLGLDARSSPSFKDYVNYVLASNQVTSFKTTASFSGSADFFVNKNFALGIEYNLQTDSYNAASDNGIGGAYEISYNFHRPSVLAYYVIPGDGYQFKLGGGIGYRYVSFKQQFMDTQNFTAKGFGLLGRAVGNTILANGFYALIGIDLRYDFPGELSNSTGAVTNPATQSKMNLNMLCIGIFLGLTFKI